MLAEINVVVGMLNVKVVPLTTDATVAPVGTLVPATNCPTAIKAVDAVVTVVPTAA